MTGTPLDDDALLADITTVLNEAIGNQVGVMLDTTDTTNLLTALDAHGLTITIDRDDETMVATNDTIITITITTK